MSQPNRFPPDTADTADAADKAVEATRRWPGVVVAVVVTFAFAAIGTLATTSGLDPWYADLEKPSWTPPSWLFSPVWTALYIAMAVAAWRVWSAAGPRAWPALVVYMVQLALNAAWSVLFFGLENPAAAAVDIVALLLAIVATMVMFARHDRVAVYLLVPYLLWTGFATALNLSIWSLN